MPVKLKNQKPARMTYRVVGNSDGWWALVRELRHPEESPGLEYQTRTFAKETDAVEDAEEFISWRKLRDRKK